MTSTWGNPEASTYGKVYLRVLAFGDVRAKVHREVHPVLARAIDDLQDAGRKVAALDATPDGRAFTLDVVDADAEQVTAALAAYGFQPRTDQPGYEWGGTIESLRDAAAALASAPEKREEEPEHHGPVGDEYDGLIAGRDVQRGDHGSDVRFLQHVFGQPASGVFDDMLEAAVKGWQERHNQEPTGIVGTGVWRALFPRTQPRPQSGDAGWRARIATSALAAKGWIAQPQDIYGVRVARAVRSAQIERNLRPSGKVERREWSMLVDWPWP